MKTLFTLLFVGIVVAVFGQTRPLYVPNVSNTPAPGDFVVFSGSNYTTSASRDGGSLSNLNQTPWRSDISSGGYNLWTTDNMSLGYSPAVPPSLLAGSGELFSFGMVNFSSADFITSSDIFAYGFGHYDSALIKFGQFMEAHGFGGLASGLVTNAAYITLSGYIPLYGATVIDSSDIYTHGYIPGQNSIIRSSTNLTLIGEDAGMDATFSFTINVTVNGRGAFKNGYMVNSRDIFALGTNALANARLTNSSSVWAIGTDAGTNLSGSYTQVFMLGAGAIVSTNWGQFDFGLYPNGFRFRGPVNITGPLSADGSGLTNVPNSAITNTASVLSPTSQQTNYTITLYPNGYKYFLYSADTNVNITFANVAAGNGASVFINAVTSSAIAAITLPTSLLTNINLHASVTNGQAEWFNFEAIDGSSTNITAIAGGLHRR